MSEPTVQAPANESKNDGSLWESPSPNDKPSEPFPSGPYRCASHLGMFVTLFELRDVQAKIDSLGVDCVEATLEAEAKNLGGYMVGLQCILKKDDQGEISASFVLCLHCGEWDTYMDWPFAKKLTVVLSHVDGLEKDIRLPISATDESDVIKKPAPGSCNKGHQSDPLSWKAIKSAGLVFNGTLYVNVELE
ncbi:hypothetical protein HPB51_017174 [Rhipicephalus microplus]|uniref:TRAF1-6 MATH domain-containing protein n=1 Tax=Rhipicephalus microplus TaxID=6941 RepID=A0A9J6EAP3_RHIMP|nr:hypothetical protein HPB51_017174 [Rhipicephalus microplus]